MARAIIGPVRAGSRSEDTVYNFGGSGMNGQFVDNYSSLVDRTKAHGRAFSLAELVVSIGILVLVLTLASQVMTLSVDSTGQAKALTEVNQALRVLERTLREDLAGVSRPGPGVTEPSLMLIEGNPINAYWTREEQEIGAVPETPPRADVLMFFTRGEARTYVQYEWPNLASNHPMRGVSNPLIDGWKQVVYGHADLGEYVPNDPPNPPYLFEPGPDAFVPYPPTSTDPDPSPIPAESWHLARRMVHLMDWSSTSNQPIAEPNWLIANDVQQHLNDPSILRSEVDVIESFDYERYVVGPPSASSQLGEYPRYLPRMFDNFFNGPPHARSRLDPTPPALYIDRLGHYFLPNCASFKVEWALDPNSEFVGGRLGGEKQIYWFDQGDKANQNVQNSMDNPLRSLEDVLKDKTNLAVTDPHRYQRLDQLLNHNLGGEPPLQGNTTPQTYSLVDRFRDAPQWFPLGWPRSLAVFAATRLSASDELIPEEIFPSVLRITVELYDDERRLEKPVRHVMIIPVGSE